MSTVVLEHVQEIAASWRGGVRTGRWDSPAGPLFSREYAEADITMLEAVNNAASTYQCVTDTPTPVTHKDGQPFAC